MQARSHSDGQIIYGLEEFCRDYGHPDGLLFTFEVTSNAVMYVYEGVEGEVSGDQVIFELNSENLVDTRKAH